MPAGDTGFGAPHAAVMPPDPGDYSPLFLPGDCLFSLFWN